MPHDTGGGQDVEFLVGDIGRGQGNATQTVGLARECVEHVFVAMSLNHRLHDYAALDPQRVVQMEHVIKG